MPPTQKTSKGFEIPIPKEEDFERLVKKVAKPVKKLSRVRRPKK